MGFGSRSRDGPDGVAVNPLMPNVINYLWPANSLTGSDILHNYAGAGINLSNSYNGVIKLDHQFNEKNNIAIRYFGGTGNQTEYVGSAMPSYFQACPSRMHNFSLVYNAVITPRLLAQTLVGVNYFKQVFDDANHGFNMASVGMETGVTDPTDFGSPTINISGFDSTGLTPPLGRIDTTGHIDQTFTYTVGSHQFRFGGDYRYSRLDVFYDANAPGRSPSMAPRDRLPPQVRPTPGASATPPSPDRSTHSRISFPAALRSGTPASPTATSSAFTTSLELPFLLKTLGR
jgi:hypothetical protein